MKLFTDFLKFCNENKRLILTGVTIGEVAISGYLWYRSGIKASEVLKEKKEEKELCDQNDKQALRAVKMETIKEVAPIVALPTIFTAITMGTIIFSHKINTKDILVLSSAYTLTKDRLKEKESKMLEVLGEKKAKEVDGAIIKDHMKVDQNEKVIYETRYGDTLCKDYYSGRYFTSSPTKIQQVILELSNRLVSEMWIPLNELYYKLGLDPVPLGDDLGFNVQDTIRGQIPITSTAVLNEYNVPCYCIEYDVSIRQKYLIEAR